MKVLPFCKPIISHVPFDNCVLGILQNYPQTYDWIYSNFINIYITKRNGADYFYPTYLWKACPFLDEFVLPYIFIKDNYRVYTDFLEYVLDKDFYVYNVLNIKYIKKYNTEVHDVHNSFIFGIDKKRRIVKMYDFFYSGIYEEYECTYDEINNAFKNISQCDWFNTDNFLDNFTKTFLLRYKANVIYTISKETLKENIISYLSKRNLLENNFVHKNALYCEYDDEYFWGTDCWKNILHGDYILRHFSLLIAYSSMWKYRYEYFVEKNYIRICEEMEVKINDLNKMARIMMNSYIKYVIKKSQEVIIDKQMSNYIENFLQIDSEICNFFLEII